ncbi:hypothetical protein [Myxococcus sp. AB025B]|uniref:hypothetical protein n=1 Tax=Myxococcus sp. AB025B TaxID=2562794 RepID=UPI00129CDBA7|nr:hypothetical protein [Myxococcus sp. AB025B]
MNSRPASWLVTPVEKLSAAKPRKLVASDSCTRWERTAPHVARCTSASTRKAPANARCNIV